MARLTFDDWWSTRRYKDPKVTASAYDRCKSAWEACEVALRAEQADAIALAVARAYLDAAAECDKRDNFPTEIQRRILAKTPADAKAAMLVDAPLTLSDDNVRTEKVSIAEASRRLFGQSRSLMTLQIKLAERDATIERLSAENERSVMAANSLGDELRRLQAELADAKRDIVCNLSQQDYDNLVRDAMITRKQRIDAAKGGSQP